MNDRTSATILDGALVGQAPGTELNGDDGRATSPEADAATVTAAVPPDAPVSRLGGAWPPPVFSQPIEEDQEQCSRIRRVTLAPETATLPSPAASPEQSATPTLAVAEFFAGIGLARLGLEKAGLRVTWANDMSSDKHDMYRTHFRDEHDHYVLSDIKKLAEAGGAPGLPRDLGLAWASFPCTDLSLAGGRKGLAGKHSGTFYDFMKILTDLGHHQPPVVALENVNGFATSHGGKDLQTAVQALNDLGYSVDVLTLDARSWVPQSRPRLFVVGAKETPKEEAPENRNAFLRPAWLNHLFENDELTTHRAALPSPPPHRTEGWTELIKKNPPVPEELWWDDLQRKKFESELSSIQRKRVEKLQESGSVVYRTAYRRTRNGVPAWEIRADDVAGCLRTTGGGSSKQAVVRIAPDGLRVRWMTPREYACLMGADEYTLPQRTNQALMGFGDAVCVNAVAWLGEHYLKPLIEGASKR
ncbi:DNA (cytosine-5-)-methyltransferase [Streptomyces sp. NPDC007251]|uniref:DNA cytosine methyltransferase n=1 Tax=unclassified Streptomyces TaxID=2593676 RepID=UPI0033F7F276